MSVPRVAMILAAGRGERMRPLTARRAKPALPVFGVPMVVRVARALAEQGVGAACVNAHHAADSILDVVSRFPAPGLDVESFVEPVLMGSGGALAAPAARLAAEEWFALQNADTLVSAPLEQLLDAAASGSGRIGALLVRPAPTDGYGAVIVDGDRFVGLERDGAGEGRAGARATYLGAAVLHRDVLERVPRDRPSELFRDVLGPLLAAGRELAVVSHDGDWLEFTSPRLYLQGLVRLAWAGRGEGRVDLPGGAAAVRAHAGGVLYAGEGASVERGAILRGAVLLEGGARARRGAALEDSLLLGGAEARAGSMLKRVIAEESFAAPGRACHGGVLADADPSFVPFGT